MRRGHISNNSSPTIWVSSDVLLVDKGRKFFIGPHTEEPRRLDWLWAVNDGYKAIIIYIDRPASAHLGEYESLTFPSVQEARQAFYLDQRAAQWIVEDTALVTPPDILAYHKSAGLFKNYGH